MFNSTPRDEPQDAAQKADQLRASLISLTQHYEILTALNDDSGVQTSGDKAQALDALMTDLQKVGIQFRESHGLPDDHLDSWDDDEGA